MTSHHKRTSQVEHSFCRTSNVDFKLVEDEASTLNFWAWAYFPNERRINFRRASFSMKHDQTYIENSSLCIQRSSLRDERRKCAVPTNNQITLLANKANSFLVALAVVTEPDQRIELFMIFGKRWFRQIARFKRRQ